MKTVERAAAPVPDARVPPSAEHQTVVLVAILVAAVLALAVALSFAGGFGGDDDPVRVAPSAPLPPSPAERDQPEGQWGPGFRR